MTKRNSKQHKKVEQQAAQTKAEEKLLDIYRNPPIPEIRLILDFCITRASQQRRVQRRLRPELLRRRMLEQREGMYATRRLRRGARDRAQRLQELYGVEH